MNRRIGAWALCIGLILALLTASVYLFMEAQHDCTGEGCEICGHMAEVEALLKSMAQPCLGLLMLLAALVCLRVLLNGYAAVNCRAKTLVSLKVRLND